MLRPIVGITLGDPCGIGPEITVKALMQHQVHDTCRPLVIGSAEVLMRAAAILKAEVAVHPIVALEQAVFQFGTIDVLDQPVADIDKLVPGQLSAQAGEAAYKAVDKVIELAMSGEIDATVTGPLNKEALHLAGRQYAGHTEIFAEKTRTSSYAMMLVHDGLRVVHVSTHVSLRDACDRCKMARELETIHLANKTCRQLGIENPRIGVAGLNPHAGENGLFGQEEIDEIIPAIGKAREEGIDAQGPFPPDSLFPRALGRQFDVVIAQYHDQGHIPLKMIGFKMDAVNGKWVSVSGVNITLGLPIIRTSVDHGTAFDQAGKGSATEESLVNAIHYAALLASHRSSYELQGMTPNKLHGG